MATCIAGMELHWGLILMHVPVDADLMEDIPGLICWVILVQGDEELRQSLRLQLATLVAMSRKVWHLERCKNVWCTSHVIKTSLPCMFSFIRHGVHTCVKQVCICDTPLSMHGHPSPSRPATPYLFDEVADSSPQTSDHLHDGVVAGRVEFILQLLPVCVLHLGLQR